MDSLDTKTLNKCNYRNVDECPHDSYNGCGELKVNCNHPKPSNKKKWDINKYRVIFFVSLGVIAYLISLLFLYVPELKNLSFARNIHDILLGFAISTTSGAIISYVIDLPSKLKDYENSFIDAITSNSYLNKLDEDKLTQLRKDVTKQLHTKNTPNMSKGIIELDEKICNLLKEPYYSRYRQKVIVRKSDKNLYFEKENIIEYKLINPHGKNKPVSADITFSSYISVEDTTETGKDYLKIIKVSCLVDNVKKNDFTKDIYLDESTLDTQIEYYNRKITICREKAGQLCSVEFSDNIVVYVHFIVTVPCADICFTKRLQQPAKNFRIDYILELSGYKPYGQIFGTEIGQIDISSNFHNNNTLSLETYDWMLPQNGAFIVMVPVSTINSISKCEILDGKDTENEIIADLG